MSGWPENGGQGQEKMYASSKSRIASDPMLAGAGGESREQQHICIKNIVLTFGESPQNIEQKQHLQFPWKGEHMSEQPLLCTKKNK